MPVIKEPRSTGPPYGHAIWETPGGNLRPRKSFGSANDLPGGPVRTAGQSRCPGTLLRRECELGGLERPSHEFWIFGRMRRVSNVSVGIPRRPPLPRPSSGTSLSSMSSAISEPVDFLTVGDIAVEALTLAPHAAVDTLPQIVHIILLVALLL